MGKHIIAKENEMKSGWEHSHSGVFTLDLDKTVSYYQSLGLAPELPNLPRNPSFLTGKAVNFEFGRVTQPGEVPRLQLIYIGNLELEVLQAPVDETARFYESLGIAEIQSQVIFDSSAIEDANASGRFLKNGIKVKTRRFRIGPVAYELIQPLEGESIYKESLDRRGEGIIDLVFTVDDLERETAKLVEKGVPVIFSEKPRNGGAFVYFDTREDGGDAMIKLVQR